jgi:hypothetical protein
MNRRGFAFAQLRRNKTDFRATVTPQERGATHRLIAMKRRSTVICSAFSALLALPIVCLSVDSVVTFNEVMYHPATNEAALEWVELHNQMAVNVELSAWSLRGGVRYDFPEGTVIPGGGYVVIAANPPVLEAATGFSGALGPFSNRLSNAGESLTLRNHGGRLMDRFAYRDGGDWPVGADGSGATLAKINEDRPSAPPDNWTSSLLVGGTPGARNSEAAGRRDVAALLVAQGTAARAHVPADDSLASTWTGGQEPFDDSSWQAGPLGVGYDTESAYDALIGNDIEPQMLGRNASAYVRILFTFTDPAHWQSLSLGMRYDDGFVAYLNGAEVATRNPPTALAVAAAYRLGDDDPGADPGELAQSPGTPATGTLAVGVLSGSPTYSADAPNSAVSTHSIVFNGAENEAYGTAIGAISGITDNYCVACWAKPTSSGWGIALGIGSGGQVDVAYDNGAWKAIRQGVAFYSGQQTVPVNTWAHIALVVSGGSGTLYVNGIAVATGGVPDAFDAVVAGGIWWGGSINAGNAFTGLIDDLRIFTFDAGGFNVAQLNYPQQPFDTGGTAVTWDSPAGIDRPDSLTLVPEHIDLTDHLTDLVAGTNILAIHGLNSGASSSDFLLLPELSVSREMNLRINEVSAAGDAGFFVEIVNVGQTGVDLAGASLVGSQHTGFPYLFPSQTLAPGGRAAASVAQLGFAPTDNEKLFLHANGGTVLLDAVSVDDELRGRSPLYGDKWLRPSVATPGAGNTFAFNADIVINEIMYRHHAQLDPYVAVNEEWVELYNRGATTVDLGGWKLDNAVRFTFPSNTLLGAGEYLVVANDVAALQSAHPAITVLGPFSGELSNSDECIELKDLQRNPVDEVHYYEGGRWPEYADGGGSSLELRDPDADNAAPESWGGSDEGANPSNVWTTYTYRGTVGSALVPRDWHEFQMGMMGAGEVLVDDLSVRRDPDGANQELIQSGDFESRLGTYRVIGNHGTSHIVVDPDDAGNQALRVVATGPLEYYHNHIETTFAGNTPLAEGTEYEISFRAKWLGGSRQLHTKLYFDHLARVNILAAPGRTGTPGAANSVAAANIGPTYEGFGHSPVVPEASEPVMVSVLAADPDGVTSMRLYWRTDGGTFTDLVMAHQSDGVHTAAIPAQVAETVVQFYVEGQDGLGGTSTFPPAGADSHVLYRVQDGQALGNGLHNFRLVMPAGEVSEMFELTHRMDNQFRGATVIYNEREVFYDVGAKLKGSVAGRNPAYGDAHGYTVKFNADQRFRGVHDKVKVERSNRHPTNGPGADEIIAKHMLTRMAGGLIGKYDDLVRFIAPRDQDNGEFILTLAGYEDVLLDSTYEKGSEGSVYEWDVVLHHTTGGDPEALKAIQQGSFTWIELQDLGDNKERYRWHFLAKNNRERDDYEAIIAMCKGFELTGEPLETALEDVIDISQFMRGNAVYRLFGINDNYQANLNKNFNFYRRPSDGRLVLFPHDHDFLFHLPTNWGLWNTGKRIANLIARPRAKRLYYLHMRDMIQSAFNTTYMTPWLAHYSSLLPSQDFNSMATYIQQRGDFVMSQLPSPAVPFAITDTGFTTDALTVQINGQAWIDVHDIGVAGGEVPLVPSWTSTGSGINEKFFWQVTVPVQPGVNMVVIEGRDLTGNLIASDTIVVTSTRPENPLFTDLHVSEVMVDPAGGSDYEFIELHNAGTGALDLAQVAITDAFDPPFSFADNGFTSLPPDGYVVVVRDAVAFQSRYGTNVVIAGEYLGKLSNGGERLRVEDTAGTVILDFTYSDGRGWPLPADGAGHALVPLADADQHGGELNHSGNWRAGTFMGGSPGEADPDPPTHVVLNEVIAHTDTGLPPPDDSNDKIELYNTRITNITFGTGWYLSDDVADLTKWQIPAGTAITSHGWLLFDEANHFHNPRTEGFGLDKAGERVLLSYLPGDGTDRVVDWVRFKGQENGVSLGRYPDGAAWWRTMIPSPGLSNLEPVPDVVISELMYNPAATNDPVDEYIVLHNPTPTAVPLFTPAGCWRVSGEVDYVFPSNTVLSAGGHIVLVSFPPTNAAARASFESLYGAGGLGPSLQGPYGGALANGGGRVALERPQAPDLPGDGVSWVIVDEVFYFDRGAWADSADGTGLALHRLASTGAGSNPANWQSGVANLRGDGIAWPTDLRLDRASDVARLTWNAVQGLTYTLEWNTELVAGGWPTLGIVRTNGTVVVDHLPPPGERAVFYRLRVRE